MTHNDHAGPRWAGRDLYDTNGATIGVIEEVRHGASTDDAAWLIVDSGQGAKKLLVPANDVRLAGERLSVPYSRDRVAGAPTVGGGPALSDTEQASLCRYYGLVHPGVAGETAEGCDDMPDVRPAG